MKSIIKKNSILMAVILIVVFSAMEISCFVIKNYGNIACMQYDKKGKYQTYNSTEFSDYELKDCFISGDHLEVDGEEPSIIMDDISGYVDSVVITADLSQTYCQYITIYYDTGNGYEEKNKVQENIGIRKSTLKYDINQQVQGIKVSFEEIHYNPSGLPTLKLTGFVINPLTKEQCREETKDYIVCTAVVVTFTYILFAFMIRRNGISVGKCICIIALFVIMRLFFGSGYQSIIPHMAKLLVVLLNCIVTVFLILLIVRKNFETKK